MENLPTFKTEAALEGERILRPADLAVVLGLGKTATYETIKREDFPQAIQVTPTIRGWLKSEVITWLKARRTRTEKAASDQ